MTPYLAIMAVFATLAVLAPRQKPDRALWGLSFLVLVAFVGLRHKVGMDWNNYLLMIAKVREVSLWDAFAVAEPGYALLLWLSELAGTGVYGVNLVGAFILMLGVFRFSARTPLPWVSLAASLPILVIVVGMSANRQAMAIGVLMWLVAGWQTASMRQRVALTLLAAMFHFSAIFFLMFAVLGLNMKSTYKLIIASVMVLAMVTFLQMTGGADYYDDVYVSGQSETTFSSGAIIHVLLNGIPALLVFLRRPLRIKLFPTTLMIQMACVALSLIPLALIFSAASGRMTLYLFPVSMYVFSALPSLMPNVIQRAVVRTVSAGALTVILWYWLSFANSSAAHVPYSNVVWVDARELHL